MSTQDIEFKKVGSRIMGRSEYKYLIISSFFGYVIFGPIKILDRCGYIKMTHYQNRNLYFGLGISIVISNILLMILLFIIGESSAIDDFNLKTKISVAFSGIIMYTYNNFENTKNIANACKCKCNNEMDDMELLNENIE